MDNENAVIPAKVIARARKADTKLVHVKSQSRYYKELELFQRWQTENGVETICKDVIMANIDELSEKFAPNSLYTKISMLKSSLLARENTDIGQYHKIDSYLRRNAIGYTPKKSKTLSKEEVLKFLYTAPDEDYLLVKFVLTFGIFGACRRGELTFMKTKNIEDKGSVLVINIHETKNYKTRSFCILEDQELNAMSLYRKYIALRPDNIEHERFFLSFIKGRCTRQPVGKNTIGGVFKKIETFLCLENPHLYTGHCLRRSSATHLADAGGDITTLKRLGGWKSTTVAEGYIDSSMASKKKICRLLDPSSESTEVTESGETSVEKSKSTFVCKDVSGIETKYSGCANINFHNCTINNIYVSK